MPISFARFLVIESLAVAALNAGMNAAYTSHLWADRSALSLRGDAGIGADLATTPIFIAFLSTLLGTAAIRKKLADGKVMTPGRISGSAFFDRLPGGILARAATMAVLAALLLAAPLYVAIAMLDLYGLSLGQAVTAKVAITLFYSLLLVPFAIAAAALDIKAGRATALRMDTANGIVAG